MAKSPKIQNTPKTEAPTPPKVRASKSPKTQSPPPEVVVPVRPKGKLAALVELLSRPEGATIGAMTEATGWQAHSVRGAVSGSLRKAMGLTVVSEKTETGRVYRITEGAPA